ncbi:MAG: hypothetical protein ACFFBR_06700 [Promethearchaeota archaeon]
MLQSWREVVCFLVTDGFVLTRLPEADRAEAFNLPKAKAFESDQRVKQKWVQLPIKEKSKFFEVMPYVMKSYQNALRAEK